MDFVFQNIFVNNENTNSFQLCDFFYDSCFLLNSSSKKLLFIKVVYIFYFSDDSSPFVTGFVGGIVGGISINLITFMIYYSIKYTRNKSENGEFFIFNNKLKRKSNIKLSGKLEDKGCIIISEFFIHFLYFDFQKKM